jgi:hypothetical protein
LKPYLIINFILAGVIGFIFIYSALFSAQKDNHPVPSFYEEATGEPSPSSGISRAFSEIMRGNLKSARNYNPDALLIFAFFGIQFFQRLGVSLLLIKRMGISKKKHLLYADVLSSIILFLYCFAAQFQALFQYIKVTPA